MCSVGARVVLTMAGRMHREDHGKPYLGEIMTVVGVDAERGVVEVAGDDGRRDVYYAHGLLALAGNPQSD